jgi:hypothetical protein
LCFVRHFSDAGNYEGGKQKEQMTPSADN